MLRLVKFCFTIFLVLLLAGCATIRSKRYKGWEYVRIEKQIPKSNCEYKIQEACSKPGASCYNYFKQRAILYGANTVVITDIAIGQTSKSSAIILNTGGGADYKSEQSITALADYYFCPQEKQEEK